MVRKYLSNRERILLHLSTFSGEVSYFNAPHSLTQEGIAESVGIGRNNVPRELKKLIEDGLITSQKARVSGLRNKRNIYYLTPAGIRRARMIREEMENIEVRVLTPEGDERYMRLKEVPSKFGVGFVPAALNVDRECTLDIASVKAPGKIVHYIEENMVLSEFYGRRKELGELKKWLKSDKKILLLTGMPGIGKTSLMLKFVRTYAKDRNVFFIKITKNDITFDLAYRLGKFYSKLGRPKLERYLAAVIGSNGTYNHCENIRQLILKEVRDEILIFDSVENASPSVKNAIRWFISKVGRDKRFKVVVIGTEVEGIVPLSKLPFTVEMNVDELRREDALRYLRHAGVTDENANRIVETYGCNPLILSLARTNDESVIRKYLLDGILSNLKSEERLAVEYLSVFRRPVKMGAFLKHGIEYPVIYGLVKRNIIKEYEYEVYSLIPLIENFIYPRLSDSSRRRYHIMAAEYLLDSGDVLEAAYHFLKGGDPVRAGMLLSDRYEDYIYKSPGFLKSVAIDILNSTVDGVETVEWNMCGIIGEVLLMEGRWDEAEEYFYRAMNLAEHHDASYWAFSGVRLAALLGKRGEIDNAIRIIRYILDHQAQISKIEHISLAYYVLGNLLRIRGDIDGAEDAFSRALEFAQLSEKKDVLGYAYMGMGIMRHYVGDLEGARMYFERARQYFMDAEDKVGFIKVTRNIGNLYYEKKDASCEKYMQEALRMAEKVGDRYNAAVVYRDLGNWALYNDKYDEALSYFTKSEEILKNAKAVEDLSYLYNSMGIYYSYLGNPDEGLKYFEMALEMAEFEGNKRLMGVISRCAIEYLAKFGDDYVKKFRIPSKYFVKIPKNNQS
ncbi:MAG: tetratricopeptide repeat protein [Euryarchaeota archaeon]|nr:tetratricopeptide repeat protein [Euryarchaeota archaeon]